MNVQEMLEQIGVRAQQAAFELAQAPTEVKNQALQAMAAALLARQTEILAANALDMEQGRAKGLAQGFLDRLLLSPKRLQEMADGLLALREIADPIGEILADYSGAQDIQIRKIRVPLGVVAIIYEARPNVTADAAGICLKTGNAVILRGGSDALNSNQAVAKVLADAIESCGLPAQAVQLLTDTGREAATALMRLNQYVDVLIPRGGAGLIRSVVEQATVPVIETGAGNCHAYIDSAADLEMAVQIVINGKVQRPAVCNALESLLVNREIAAEFLPRLAAALQPYGVELRGCAQTCALLPACHPAAEDDYYREYNDLILSIKVVDSVEQAIAHINHYGTHHSEVIVTANAAHAEQFQRQIDAAAVYVNASTRFTDGFQFGFGAEIGISTQKLHARGPMGLTEMTSYKYLVCGDGQTRK